MNSATTLSVELKGVVKRFGALSAVDRVDLQVERGEFFSLLGPSGCGKTTMLHMIGGLKHPDKGDIFIKGERVNGIPPYKRDASIVFQNLALFPHMTIEQNIAFGLKLRKLPRHQIQTKVSQMLDLVQLNGLERRRPDQLSGGQQQRVALVRSLILQPEVLLLDEPLASLDRKLRKEMQLELRRIQRDVGITFIYVTHDQKEALSMSDRIAVMKDGAIVQLGSPVELYEQPRTRFVADFMGSSNLFEGNIIRKDGCTIRVRTARNLEIMAKAMTDDFAENTPVHISVRPKAIELQVRAERAQAENVFAGTVISLMYLGEVIEAEVGLACGQHVIAHLSTTSKSESIEIGQSVWVSWAAADTNLMSE